MTAIDWPALRAAATAAMKRAYAPYSHFPVGAAALTSDGRIVTGSNVENASYGMTLCAECSLVSALYGAGAPSDATFPTPPRLLAVSVVDASGAPLTPCGRCRQLLHEHGGPTLQLETTTGVHPLSTYLPDAFGPEYL
ncbi:cytidine deaminase [Actinocorallia sp. A-T 12471]|uniref:cytidine deaminase n=1 Tax=Actinocorallia sp. A-T 12471 TaxID=3089813 RepID=UPI0029CF4C89|nr:cytidine deaminase [Actinocorallia sp. A-T 12471]MDX6744510.1 cytidine deaminase [Actinocorallia sp. A-T 12471]